jgi:ArsR family transcriptional regulator, arsenate/arsenite/antimonite-responsive transcriptional repressor
MTGMDRWAIIVVDKAFYICISRYMELNHAMDTLHALSQETRLKIFRLLVKSGPGGLQAGEIARRVAAPQNTISTHLAVLARARLVTRTRKGREIIYAPQLAVIHDLVLFLTHECCEGRPELCGPIVDDLTRPLFEKAPG